MKFFIIKRKNKNNLVECYFPNCQWEIGKANFFTFNLLKRAGFKSKKIIKNWR